jgi:hypothetical protein
MYGLFNDVSSNAGYTALIYSTINGRMRMDKKGNNRGQPESNYPADTFWCVYFEQ